MSVLGAKLGDQFVFAASITLPFVLLGLVPSHVRHWGDIYNFGVWANCLDQFGHQIYLVCADDVNYPAAGLYFSAGALSVIGKLANGTDHGGIFRHYLAAIDALNIVLFALLTFALRLPRPLLVAALFFVLPSTFAGGALWGQIDNLSLCFSLAVTLCLAQTWSAGDQTWRSAWCVAAAAAMAVFILIKQTSVFSFPYFAVLVLVTAILLWQEGRTLKALAPLGVFAATFLVVFLALDRSLAVPPGYFGSSYYFVWTAGGSPHGDVIATHGFNLWVLLGGGVFGVSAHEPFALTWGNRLPLYATPYRLGMALFVTISAFLLGVLLWAGRRMLRAGPLKAVVTHPAGMAVLLLYHGLGQLAFNVALTGTHERYMYLAYPYILLAAFVLLHRGVVVGPRLVIYCLFCAVAFGVFVLDKIAGVPGALFAFKRHEFIATLHLLLLVMLLDVWWRLLSTPNDRMASAPAGSGQAAPTS